MFRPGPEDAKQNIVAEEKQFNLATVGIALFKNKQYAKAIPELLLAITLLTNELVYKTLSEKEKRAIYIDVISCQRAIAASYRFLHSFEMALEHANKTVELSQNPKVKFLPWLHLIERGMIRLEMKHVTDRIEGIDDIWRAYQYSDFLALSDDFGIEHRKSVVSQVRSKLKMLLIECWNNNYYIHTIFIIHLIDIFLNDDNSYLPLPTYVKLTSEPMSGNLALLDNSGLLSLLYGHSFIALFSAKKYAEIDKLANKDLVKHASLPQKIQLNIISAMLSMHNHSAKKGFEKLAVAFRQSLSKDKAVIYDDFIEIFLRKPLKDKYHVYVLTCSNLLKEYIYEDKSSLILDAVDKNALSKIYTAMGGAYKQQGNREKASEMIKLGSQFQMKDVSIEVKKSNPVSMKELLDKLNFSKESYVNTLTERFNSLVFALNKETASKKINNAIKICEEALQLANEIIEDDLVNAEQKSTMRRNFLTLNSKMAALQRDQNNYVSSISYYTKSIDLCNEPDLTDHKEYIWFYLFQRALVYIKNSENYSAAYKDFELALENPIKLTTDHPHFRTEDLVTLKNNTLSRLAELISILHDKKHFNEAIQFSNIALKIIEYANEKPMINFYQHLSTAYVELKQYDDALEIINRAITMEPQNIESKFCLATIYYGQGNEKALETITSAIEKKNSVSDYYQLRSKIYYKNGMYEAALKDVESGRKFGTLPREILDLEIVIKQEIREKKETLAKQKRQQQQLARLEETRMVQEANQQALSAPSKKPIEKPRAPKVATIIPAKRTINPKKQEKFEKKNAANEAKEKQRLHLLKVNSTKEKKSLEDKVLQERLATEKTDFCKSIILNIAKKTETHSFCQSIVSNIVKNVENTVQSRALAEKKWRASFLTSATATAEIMRKYLATLKTMTSEQLRFVSELYSIVQASKGTFIFYGSRSFAYYLQLIDHEHKNKIIPQDFDFQICGIQCNHEKIFQFLKNKEFKEITLKPQVLYKPNDFTQFKGQIGNKRFEITVVLDDTNYNLKKNDSIDITTCRAIVNSFRGLTYFSFNNTGAILDNAFRLGYFTSDLTGKNLSTYRLSRPIKYSRMWSNIIHARIKTDQRSFTMKEEKDWHNPEWQASLIDFFKKQYKLGSAKDCLKEASRLTGYLDNEAKPMMLALCHAELQFKIKNPAIAAENMTDLICEFYSKYNAPIEILLLKTKEIIFKTDPTLQKRKISAQEFLQQSEKLKLLDEPVSSDVELMEHKKSGGLCFNK